MKLMSCFIIFLFVGTVFLSIKSIEMIRLGEEIINDNPIIKEHPKYEQSVVNIKIWHWLLTNATLVFIAIGYLSLLGMFFMLLKM